MAAGDRRPMPRMIDRTCSNPECGKAFQARAADVNRGQGKYCSRDCAYVGNRIPTMPLKPVEDVQRWIDTAHKGAKWWDVMQYQRAEIDALRRLFPDGLRRLLEQLAAGVTVEDRMATVICAYCQQDADKPHESDCIVLQARLLVGVEGDKLL